MEFIPVIVVILLVIAFTPTSAPKGRRGRRSKGLFTSLLESQAKTRKRNARTSGSRSARSMFSSSRRKKFKMTTGKHMF